MTGLPAPECLRFNDDQQADLKTLGLEAKAIQDLEEAIKEQVRFLDRSRKVPSARSRRQALKSLHNRLEAVKSAFEGISDYTYCMRYDLQYCRRDLEKPLTEAIQLVSTLINEKERPGNEEKRLDVLVYYIARVLLRHGIKPKQHGKDFARILEIVFETINEDTTSIRSAIDRAWKTEGGNVPVFWNWRPQSIQEMIELYDHHGPSFEDLLAACPDED